MSPTLAVRPMHPPAFETISEIPELLEPEYANEKQMMEQEQYITRIPPQSLARQTNSYRPPFPPAAYPMYPGLQTPNGDRRRTDAMPMVLNRPRKLSGSSTRSSSSSSSSSSNSSVRTTDSLASSWGSRTSYDSQDSWLTHQQQQRPATAGSLSVRRKRSFEPNKLFASLPDEVLEVVLSCLKDIHLDPKSESCATCWMRDLCSLTMSSKRWYKVARFALYRDVQLVGADSALHKKKLKLNQSCRMTLLRRTLRENYRLADAVRSLKVPSLDQAGIPSGAKNSAAVAEAYENKVASLVMACPNLERLVGPLSVYDHSFKRIYQALSTRSKLKTMDWRLEPAQEQEPYRPESSCGMSSMPADLTAAQEMIFLEHHRGWTALSSLSIHCLRGASLAPGTLLERTLTCLPALKHLHLSCIPANAFNDNNLMSLPALHTLTLSHIAGISSSGLSAFATRPQSKPLRRLNLRHTPLTSLPALARLLSNLSNLSTLSLVQDFPPLMPEDDVFTLWMMPYLASASLSKLHWDITSKLPPGANDADSILARSIAADGFPSLRVLRTPNDPIGAFQALCRPMERYDLPSDRFNAVAASAKTAPGRKASFSSPSSPIKKHLKKSSTSSSLPITFSAPPPHGTDLRAARLAAQARLDDARQYPRFKVNVFGPDSLIMDSFDLAGYVGTVGSPIEYHLLPDVGSTDEKGGLVDVPDLASDAGETLSGTSAGEGCTGSWNWREGVVADKKEKERWWHTERGRWVRPQLDGVCSY